MLLLLTNNSRAVLWLVKRWVIFGQICFEFRFPIELYSSNKIRKAQNEHLNIVAHCSLLDIYISQKSSLCVVNLEDQFQTCLEAKLINFLIWKFRSIMLIFLLFFAGVVKSSVFCTLLLLFQRDDLLKFQFDSKYWLNISTFLK